MFRDVKEVTSRTVLREQPDGLKVVKVEQLGEVRIMWRTVQFKTLLTVTEDARDPDNLSTHFELIRSVCILAHSIHSDSGSVQAVSPFSCVLIFASMPGLLSSECACLMVLN